MCGALCATWHIARGAVEWRRSGCEIRLIWAHRSCLMRSLGRCAAVVLVVGVASQCRGAGESDVTELVKLVEERVEAGARVERAEAALSRVEAAVREKRFRSN